MTKISNIIILGGGTAGWISAALLKKIMGESIAITLVESDEISTIGVGEATIPPIQHLNAVIGINEPVFVKATKASIKLAIRFENWLNKGQSYYHTFSAPGKCIPFCAFHHLWLRAKKLGLDSSLWDFDLNYNAAIAGKVARINSEDPALEMPYAYHFDAGLYAALLRKTSEQAGVKRIEGRVMGVAVNSDTGDVESLLLSDGRKVAGEFFIDCSGFKAILLQEQIESGFESWGHWLPCDRAVTVASQRFDSTPPFTRSIAHSAGWQWQIPLQHRNGNGLVYSSSRCSYEQACDQLLTNIGSEPLAEPKEIKFNTGRARNQWHKNVVGIGLASGFIEPLESTSIHLIQSGVVRLAKLFPYRGEMEHLRNEYNRQSRLEFEQIRDFIILHYHLNQRSDSAFWQDLRTMSIPDTLARKIALFRESGALVREQNDLFTEASWLQVMLGQGITPQNYHPKADALPEHELNKFMRQLLQGKKQPIIGMPNHDHFLDRLMAQA